MLFLLFILHHILNWRWWTGLFKGKYTAVRALQTAINLFTLAAMAGLMVSGVILSNKVFAFLQIRGHMAFARRLHMAASYCNWWSSIPACVRTFLTRNDLSGKTIVPFCSMGGRQFGQTISAVAKLAPNSIIKEGLMVSYSSYDRAEIDEWLENISK